jgi:hypothetical protein
VDGYLPQQREDFTFEGEQGSNKEEGDPEEGAPEQMVETMA